MALVLIPARLGSSRLPNKPIADIGGKSMIQRVWELAIAADVGPVVVAAAEQEIAKPIQAAGGLAILTDPDLPSGSDRIQQAMQSYDPNGKHQIIVNLQGDLPTLDPQEIRTVVKALEQSDADVATLAAIITEKSEMHDPNVVKVIAGFEKGTTSAKALAFTRATAPWSENLGSENNTGDLYHHIGIYAYRRDALNKFVALPPSPLEKREKLEQLRLLENGMSIQVALVDSVPNGVDTPEDLEQARLLISQSKED